MPQRRSARLRTVPLVAMALPSRTATTSCQEISSILLCHRALQIVIASGTQQPHLRYNMVETTFWRAFDKAALQIY